MSCRSQNLVAWNIPQRVDGCERAAGTMRRYKLVSQLRLSRDDSVDLVVNVNFVHEVLADMVQQLMQIRVVVVDVAGIWRMVVVLLQDGKGDTAVDAQRVDRNETFVARLLLHDAELSVLEVLWTDAYQVGIPLTEIATKHEHITHSFQCLYLVPAQFQHLLRAETICRLLTNLEVIDMTNLVGRERNLAGDIIRNVNLCVRRIQLHTILG